MRGRMIAGSVLRVLGTLCALATVSFALAQEPSPSGAGGPSSAPPTFDPINPLRSDAPVVPYAPTANGAVPNDGAPNGTPGGSGETAADTLIEPAAPAETLSPLDVQQRREEVGKLEGIDPAVKTQIDDLFAQAAKDVDAASQDAGLAANYEKESASVEAKRQAIKKELDALAGSQSFPLVPADPRDANLEALLEKAKQEASAASAKQAELQAEPTRRATRRTEIPKEQTDLTQKLEEARTKLAGYSGESDPPGLATAKRTAFQAAVRKLETALKRLEREAAYYSATSDLIPMQQDLAAKKTQFAEKQAMRLSELLTQRMHREVRELADKAASTSESLPAELQPIVDRLKSRASLSAELVNRIDVVRELQRKIGANTEKWQRDFQRVKEKLELVGMSEGMGILLQQTRRRMTVESTQFTAPVPVGARRSPARTGAVAVVPVDAPEPPDDDAEGGDVEPELFDEPSEVLDSLEQLILDARLELMNLEDERTRLADPETRAAELVDRIVTKYEGQLGMPEETLLARTRELLQQDREQLNLLIKYQASYFEELVNLDTVERANDQLLTEYRAFIDERILWTPSATTSSLFESRGYSAAIAWLSSPTVWMDAFERWRRDVVRLPWIELIFLVTFVPLLLYQRRMRRHLGEWADVASRPTCQTIRPTLLALLATFLLALTWAWFGMFAGARLLSLSRPSELTLALGRACLFLAWWSFFVQFGRHLLRNKGLADSHFFWNAASRKRLRNYVQWFFPITAPLAFASVVLHVQSDEAIQNGPGRAVAIALLIGLTLFAHFIFRPTGPWANRTASPGSGAWTYPTRWIVWGAATLSPAALAILSFVGYHYTAMRLSSGLIETALLLAGLGIARATIARWMLLHRRRLAFQQARARLQNAGGEGDTESRAVEQLGISTGERQTIDLNQLSEQGRRFVGAVVGLSAGVGLLLIWQDVLPALNLLDRIVLVAADEGVSVRDVTLLSIALALAAVALMTVAVRNVPGLMELFLLPRLPFDAGARYAITTLTRYAIIIAGVVSAAYFVGFSWSQYQWLVGAAAVGLGFGLQEIFANFVSGLILLFERPIRVGDIVTIEGVTGVVSKIRMRATTVTNWDNQEFVVPNKDFVTGKLLNWTLTNARNRVLVNVGIAYHDDPDVARRALLEAAAEAEYVLKDPAPMATFEGFGDSSLNLVLRCHLENLDHRLDTIHELHVAINRKFKEAKLTIPFPQRDLHFLTPMAVERIDGSHPAGSSNGNGASGNGSNGSGSVAKSESTKSSI